MDAPPNSTGLRAGVSTEHQQPAAWGSMGFIGTSGAFNYSVEVSQSAYYNFNWVKSNKIYTFIQLIIETSLRVNCF